MGVYACLHECVLYFRVTWLCGAMCTPQVGRVWCWDTCGSHDCNVLSFWQLVYPLSIPVELVGCFSYHVECIGLQVIKLWHPFNDCFEWHVLSLEKVLNNILFKTRASSHLLVGLFASYFSSSCIGVPKSIFVQYVGSLHGHWHRRWMW